MKKQLSLLIGPFFLGLLLSPNPSFSQCLQDKGTTSINFVKNLYDWYKKQDEKAYSKIFSEKKTCFTPELFKLMEREHRGSSACPGKTFLDYDPIIGSNAFVPAEVTARVGKEESVKGITNVSVDLSYAGSNATHTVTVELVRNPFWQINDLVDPNASSKTNRSFTIVLKKLNQDIDGCIQKNKKHSP